MSESGKFSVEQIGRAVGIVIYDPDDKIVGHITVAFQPSNVEATIKVVTATINALISEMHDRMMRANCDDGVAEIRFLAKKRGNKSVWFDCAQFARIQEAIRNAGIAFTLPHGNGPHMETCVEIFLICLKADRRCAFSYS